MIVNPGIRRFLGSAIQRLFNSASFYAPLTHSLVPERGTGSPTFTRASTATFTDWEGVLRTVPSGCARFEGGRMVRNLFVTTTADMSNAAWMKFEISATTGHADPEGGTTALKLVEAAGAAVTPQIYQLGNTVAGNQFLMWIIAKKAERDFIVVNNNQGSGGGSVRGWFNLSSGTVGTVGAGGTAAITSLGDGWYLCALKSTHANGSDSGHYFQLSNADGVNTYAGDGTSGIYVWHPQLEEVTGQANQTASEYVSVGVLSAPYHGAGVDGVEFFNTDRDGAVIPAATNTGYLAEGARTNLCLQSSNLTSGLGWGSGAVADSEVTINVFTAPDGTVTMDKLREKATTAPHYWIQSYTLSVAPWTYSQHFAAAERSIVWMYIETSARAVAYFNLATGTVGTVSGTGSPSARMTLVSPSIYRCELTATPSVASVACGFGTAITDNSVSFAGTATYGLYAWGAQVELGSSASTYIPTTTAAVTRAADVDATPTASNILAAASTVYLEFTPDHTPSGTIALWGTYVDASNYTVILHDATNMIMRKRIAGVNYDATIANAFTANTTYKVCGSWGASGVTVTVNGTEGTPHANTTAAQIAATMQVGADGNSLQQPGAGTTNLRIWQRQLSSPEGVAVTA